MSFGDLFAEKARKIAQFKPLGHRLAREVFIMKYCLITFRSVTPAQKGEGVLRRAGFICNLQRTPRWMEEKGCGYSLRVRYQDAAVAIQALRKQDVSYKTIYCLNENGAAEELAL